MRLPKWILHALFLLIAFGSSFAAHAHKPSDSYLAIRVAEDSISGQWDIALRDLEFAIGLDNNGNGELTWDEIRAKHKDIAAYALSRLAISSGGTACPTTATEHLIDHHTDGAYAVLRFQADCPAAIDALEIHYSLLFDIDPQHKGLLRLDKGGQVSTAIFHPEQAKQQFGAAQTSRFRQFVDYLKHGIWHIWIGFDHILFLLSLLLPAVLVLDRRRWQAAQSFKASFIDVVKIVTAFTVAHSITLTIATLGIVQLPSRWVEASIAASVIIAALNNLIPLFHGKRWAAAFIFGLIHGFGFASVLADLGLPQATLLLALVGFNVGVEIGQLAIVSVFLPIAYAMRKTWFYRHVVFQAGSVLIILISLVWLVERGFDMELMPK